VSVSQTESASRGLPFPAVVVIGVLAVFGAITALQWVFASLLFIVKFVLVVVVVLAALGWIISAKANR